MYVDETHTAATKIDNNSTAIATIVDTINYGQSNEEFTVGIETNKCLSMNEDNTSHTIAQKIMRSRPQPISTTKNPFSN